MHLLREEWEHLEADFTRFYNGADLRALCWGDTRWSARRILGHIQALPWDSATMRSCRGEEANWDQGSELLAGVIDALRVQTYTLAKSWGMDLEVPEAVARPGRGASAPSQVQTVSLSEWTSTL